MSPMIGKSNRVKPVSINLLHGCLDFLCWQSVYKRSPREHELKVYQQNSS